MTGQHALVTGGAGFIGQHLVRRLLAEGRQVTVLDNLSVGRREAVPPGIRFVAGDVRDEVAVHAALDGVDCVFHLAAQVTVRGSFSRFYEDLDTNVMGTANLVRAIDPARIRWFTLASTMAVYADSFGGERVAESHATAPQSPYGAGKLAAEAVVRQVLGQAGVPVTVLRYFNTFGPGQGFTPYVGVITIFITQLLEGRAPTIFGDGEQRRDFIHVEDVVRATALAPGRSPGTYNIGTGRGVSVNALTAQLVALIAPHAVPVHAPAAVGEIRNSVADPAAAAAALGFVARRTVQGTLPDVVEGVRARVRAAGPAGRES